MNEPGDRDAGQPKGHVTMVVERAKARAPTVPESLLRVVVTIREVVLDTFRGFAADRGYLALTRWVLRWRE